MEQFFKRPTNVNCVFLSYPLRPGVGTYSPSSKTLSYPSPYYAIATVK
jgi:hypothetical protein